MFSWLTKATRNHYGGQIDIFKNNIVAFGGDVEKSWHDLFKPNPRCDRGTITERTNIRREVIRLAKGKGTKEKHGDVEVYQGQKWDTGLIGILLILE